MQSATEHDGDQQDNFVEAKEPTELIMCVILAAAFAGLAKFCWSPLQAADNANLLFNVEGFFITVALLSLVVGVRPYISPCSLQVSKKGVKYRGPYWPQRKSVNWDQMTRLYISPELIIVLYRSDPKHKGIWPLLIQSVYLADRERIPEAFQQYCPMEPILLSGPSLTSRFLMIFGFIIVVIWILLLLLS